MTCFITTPECVVRRRLDNNSQAVKYYDGVDGGGRKMEYVGTLMLMCAKTGCEGGVCQDSVTHRRCLESSKLAQLQKKIQLSIVAVPCAGHFPFSVAPHVKFMVVIAIK